MIDYSKVLQEIATAVTRTPVDVFWDRFFQLFLTFLAAFFGFWFALAADRRDRRRQALVDFLSELTGFLLEFHEVVQNINNYNGLVEKYGNQEYKYDPFRSHAENSHKISAAKKDAKARMKTTLPGNTPLEARSLRRIVKICDELTDYGLIMDMGKRLNGAATTKSFFVPKKLKVAFDGLVSALWYHSSMGLQTFVVMEFRKGILKLVQDVTESIAPNANSLFTNPLQDVEPIPPGSALKPGDACTNRATGTNFVVRNVVDLDFRKFAGVDLLRAIWWALRGHRTGDILCDWFHRHERRAWTKCVFRPEDLIPLGRGRGMQNFRIR